jgi:hypothetical protein
MIVVMGNPSLDCGPLLEVAVQIVAETVTQLFLWLKCHYNNSFFY